LERVTRPESRAVIDKSPVEDDRPAFHAIPAPVSSSPDLSLPGAFWQCQEGPAHVDSRY